MRKEIRMKINGTTNTFEEENNNQYEQNNENLTLIHKKVKGIMHKEYLICALFFQNTYGNKLQRRI